MPKGSDETQTPDPLESPRRREPAVVGHPSFARAGQRSRNAAAGFRVQPFSLLASLWFTAGALTAAVRAATPFDHGIWLVAYLVLVGFMAQVLLAAGQDSLRRRASRPTGLRLIRTEAVLWNIGVVAVPLGVLVNARIAVVIGSCALLGALILFARCLAHPEKGTGNLSLVLAYIALLLGMATSVVIGTALAWDIAWV